MTASTSYEKPSRERQSEPTLSSFGQLLGEVSGDLSNLMRQELELAKIELRESVSKAGKGGGMLGGAAVAGHMVLLFLSAALWWGLGDRIGNGWSGLVVALIWAVIGLVLFAVGRAQLKGVTGLPQTTSTAKRIPNALKGKEERR
ncbi:MAG: hypothetical protein QOE58_2689 [Actinomycetota bacterium]|jgi:hypothetical protein|nr:hypothetical protein [Actinomycetota bacterium]